MSASTGLPGQPGLDAATAEALREILAAPALPVGGTAGGPDAGRLTALREALDYVGSRRLLADETRPFDRLAALAQTDAALADSLGWHAALTGLLASLPAGRARNAVLGDVRRGALLTWATSVSRWRWQDDRPPAHRAPLGRAEAELVTDDFPGLYDTIVGWEPAAAALIAIPTHRDRVTWAHAGAPAPASPALVRSPWTVRLADVTFHLDELIPLSQPPSIAPPVGRR
ncbi:MAG: hypothetical protein JO016_19820 [Actinobacteria bacterium]|nr:hypothetical protein [Actinomycetota bacterium]